MVFSGRFRTSMYICVKLSLTNQQIPLDRLRYHPLDSAQRGIKVWPSRQRQEPRQVSNQPGNQAGRQRKRQLTQMGAPNNTGILRYINFAYSKVNVIDKICYQFFSQHVKASACNIFHHVGLGKYHDQLFASLFFNDKFA